MRFVFTALLWILVSSAAAFGHENAHAVSETHGQQDFSLKSPETAITQMSFVALSCETMNHCVEDETDELCDTPDCQALCLANIIVTGSPQGVSPSLGKGKSLELSLFLSHKGLSIPPPIPPPLAPIKS